MSPNHARWDRRSVAPGPIALKTVSNDATCAGDILGFLVATESSGVVLTVDPNDLGAFIVNHSSEVFVCVGDADHTHWQLCQHFDQNQDSPAVAALWKLSRTSRWLDLRHTDRVIRCAEGDHRFGLRESVTIAIDKVLEAERSSGPKTDVDELRCALQEFRRLVIKLDELRRDAEAPRRPRYEVKPPNLEEQQEIMEKTRRFFELRATRKLTPRGLADKLGPLVDMIRPTVSFEEVASKPRAVDVVPLNPFSAPGLEVRAAIAFSQARRTCDELGFEIGSAGLANLLKRAEVEYKEACQTLFDDDDAREMLHWEAESPVIRLNNRGHIDIDRKKLGEWLRKKFARLRDALNGIDFLPRDPAGQPPRNPEHWGLWAGCDRTLWAWRQVMRMAELRRLLQPGGTACPRWESVPSLRSWEPNLKVYRDFGEPVFRPRAGYNFVSGRIGDLHIRCTAAVCVHRGYASRGSARLYNNLLCQQTPLTVVTEELYMKFKSRAGKLTDEAAQAHSCELRAAADTSSHDTSSDGTTEWGQWIWITNALLETAPLGLPDDLLMVLLETEYGLNFDRTTILELRDILRTQIAYELESLLRPRTIDLVASRLNRTANEAISRFVHEEHPETSDHALQNAVLGRNRHPMRLADQGIVSEQRTCPENDRAAERTRKGILEYRAFTLGGRLTRRETQQAVQRQEILMAADEVMIEVAFDLVAAGYKLLGVAGNEFVVEAPVTTASHAAENIAKIASQAAQRLLGDLLAPVQVEIVDAW